MQEEVIEQHRPADEMPQVFADTNEWELLKPWVATRARGL